MTIFISTKYDLEHYTKMDMITLFRDTTNPNYNSSTLYHGIDDILHGVIPRFFQDNLEENQLEILKNNGWKIEYE